ncbi:PadR family transcriptional regulator [Rhodococcus spelaei]|uniref:PadR family transcriptional regulator n=1 Tax=Rhodococcus spelaei TaxID=2546320 RepID=A0A541B260_9NOCA|nr:PadR family transcriptional regulator [Rhodococcus spelaei]TQF66412.1 PadR family transcriptional regulator [Rhodococcus spelaei]
MENMQRHNGRGRRHPGHVGRDRRADGFGADFGFGPDAGFGPGRRGAQHGGERRGGFGGGRHDHRGGPGGEHFGRGRGRGGRGRRGDVRAAVLLLLAESPMHGYELIQRIAERSDGLWKPSPGSVYPALAQLEDEGLVLIEKVAGRKTARLTESGVTFVEENKGELGDPWGEVRAGVGREARDLRELVGALTGAVRQVASVGTPDQARAAGEVLVEARRALYRILADEPTTVESPDESDPETSR